MVAVTLSACAQTGAKQALAPLPPVMAQTEYEHLVKLAMTRDPMQVREIESAMVQSPVEEAYAAMIEPAAGGVVGSAFAEAEGVVLPEQVMALDGCEQQEGASFGSGSVVSYKWDAGHKRIGLGMTEASRHSIQEDPGEPKREDGAVLRYSFKISEPKKSGLARGCSY